MEKSTPGIENSRCMKTMPGVFTEEARTTLIRETKRKQIYNENEKEVNYGKKTLKKKK